MTPDAEYLARSLFWFTGNVTFQEVEARPTARTQAALDELVKEGVISVTPYNEHHGRVYQRVTQPFTQPATQKMHDSIGKGFSLTERINKGN